MTRSGRTRTRRRSAIPGDSDVSWIMRQGPSTPGSLVIQLNLHRGIEAGPQDRLPRLRIKLVFDLGTYPEFPCAEICIWINKHDLARKGNFLLRQLRAWLRGTVGL